ncbi:hypothetical protein DL762_003802 [Monosporascus cannonballus]|uniref:DNA primase n=1 Tax=Monosporascus cannonballus TaxID=155416 RepID=A0ABY0HA53_9PEZI|nr:hypothetical protein DL762_003802 [Monosporascus cannonballus]
MPHSVTPHSESPPNSAEQTMAEARTTNAQNGDSQNTDEERDITMAEPDALPAAAEPEDKQEVKLEDLFADVDSDEEFPSSRVEDNKLPSSPVAPSSPAIGGLSLKSSDPELMRMFYQRLFPWRYLFQWLNHSPTPTNDFGHREFAFTMPNDQYWRYQSYPTADLLRKDVLRHMPTRFEIGPVYSTNPRDRKTLRNSSAFRPVSKELCFDIDLTDYDDVRTCCDKANICGRCWAFITMAIQVVDAALRDDFGFRHVLWVYSGRRGAHAWVCDRKARSLDDQKRRAIAGYLDVVRGGAQAGKRVSARRPLHPHLSRSLDLLAPHFQATVLGTQDPWRTAERAEHLLSLLPDGALNAALRSKWESSPDRPSESKWADIDAVARAGGGGRQLDGRALLEAKQDVVLEYAYPRLDIEVSKKLNHLLKSPFVVHPGTGRVCVPIDTRTPGALERFDPLAVPTAQQLVQEIDAWHGDDDDDKRDGDGDGVKREGGEGGEGEGPRRKKSLQDWEKTSLRPHIEYFRGFVLGLMRDERGESVRVKREREDGEGVEF